MKKTSKIISTLSALSMLASMCVIPAAHAEGEYTFDRSGANFVAGTDFENRYSVGNFETADAGNFLSDMWSNTNAEFSSTQKHSGSYSLHTKAAVEANAGISTDNGTWAYWNENVSPRSLEVGKTYKYSYWVYADEDATVTTPNVLAYNGNNGGSDWLISGSSLPKQQWNYFETVFTAKTKALPFFYKIPANLYIDDIKLEEVVAPQMTATTLPANGKTDSVGRKNYTVTFDKDIASATVKVGTSTVANTISTDKKTVSFEVLFERDGEKTVTVDVTDTDGATAQVTRTFTIRDTWVAFADFDRNSTYSGFAGAATWGFLDNFSGSVDGDVEFSNTKAHTGQYSFHAKATVAGEIKFAGCWDYWKDSNHAIQVGHTYKYSFWVYADDAAEKTTPSVLVRKEDTAAGKRDFNWLLSNDKVSYPKNQWNYVEVMFTAVKTELPIFPNIPANLYIDDILLEEIPTASVVSTTLPGEGTNAALGYNKYTMTFDKEIKSANVAYNGKTTAADVSTDGKTISFGIAAVKNGNVTVTITDADDVTSTVTRAITVPDTMVFYTGFDNGQTAGYYVNNNGWDTPLKTDTYRSPGAALRIVTTEQYGASIDVVSNRLDGLNYSQIDEGTAVFEKGKWYKVSFYGKTGGAVGTRPQIGVARRNESGNGFGVRMFTMTDEMTKYEVTFKAISNKKPFLYREEMNDEIIIDDLLVEQVEAPVDYTYDLSAKTVKADAAITATLSNEKLVAMNGVALVALYKDGVMQTCSVTPVTNLAKGAEITTNAVTVPSDINDGEYTVKAFLWDNATTSMAPICNALQISESVAAQ